MVSGVGPPACARVACCPRLLSPDSIGGMLALRERSMGQLPDAFLQGIARRFLSTSSMDAVTLHEHAHGPVKPRVKCR